MLTEEIKIFLRESALQRFLRYVKVWTTSEENSNKFPSTERQFDLGKILVNEMKELGFADIVHDIYGYVYGKLPASRGYEYSTTIGFIAHLDTSGAVSGQNVKPVIHKGYNGGVINFELDKDLTLTPENSPELENYLGLDIITASGDTLLGADDKAGIAEIMAACETWKVYPELIHGPITVCFTPDEETGKGTEKIDLENLPKYCYTVDGGELGEFEYECFDAWKARLRFKGLSVHPGYAKGKMINEINIAYRFLSQLPEQESPEYTEDREGYYYVTKIETHHEELIAYMLIRDFKIDNNQKRMKYLRDLADLFKLRYPGVEIEIDFEHQYENMINYFEQYKKVLKYAQKAIEKADLEVKMHHIRGGTDGSRLSEKGIPTPNLFTGGLLFHSRKEYIPITALQKASEVIIHLASMWATE